MNYIRHLNTFFNLVRNDSRLSSIHVSLYMAIFHNWNINRFHSPIQVPREDLMKLSAIGSKNTYLKSIRELQQFGYIKFKPGCGKFSKCQIHIIHLENTPPNQITLYCPQNDTVENEYSPTIDPVPKKYCPKSGTHTVPHLTDYCPKIDPDTVPYLGPLIKQNNKRINYAHSSEKFFKNILEEKENIPPTVPNMGQITEFFTSNDYPAIEAEKFYQFFESIGWLAGGKTPIQNWQAAAHKWILNIHHNPKPKSNVNSHITDLPQNQSYDQPF